MAKRDSLCWYLDLYKIDIIESTLLCSLHQLNSNKNVKLEIQRNPWGIWNWTSITPVLLMENWIGKGWHSFFLPPTPKVIILFINKNKTKNRGEKKIPTDSTDPGKTQGQRRRVAFVLLIGSIFFFLPFLREKWEEVCKKVWATCFDKCFAKTCLDINVWLECFKRWIHIKWCNPIIN